MLELSTVRPSDFDLESGFIGSYFQNSEKETLAKNVVIICLKNGNTWLKFTFDDYMRFCAPRTNFRGEEAVLDALAKEDEVLDKVNGRYSVNDRFLRVLKPFIRK